MTQLLEEPQVQMNGTQINANMAGVDIIVRRPSGRVMPRKGVDVIAKDEHDQSEQLTRKQVTRPQLIIDGGDAHSAWVELDNNSRSFDVLLKVFSINDARRGFHLVPMSKVGAFIAEASKLREERKAIARKLAAGYEDWMANLRKRFNGHFYLLQGKIPPAEDLEDKFDVVWTIHPLTPISAEHIDFAHLADEDRMAIVDESNRMAQDLIKARAKTIYDEVFGKVMEKCDEIAQGTYFTGMRKFGAIDDMVNLLQRLLNFQEFATDKSVVMHAQNMLQMFDGITDVNEINNNHGNNQVTAAIAAAVAPLGSVLSAMLAANKPGSGKSKRAIEV